MADKDKNQTQVQTDADDDEPDDWFGNCSHPRRTALTKDAGTNESSAPAAQV